METRECLEEEERPLLIPLPLLEMATHGRSASVSEGSSKYNFPSKILDFKNQNCHKSKHLQNIRVSELELAPTSYFLSFLAHIY